jgi:hypothetical protein
MNNPSKFGLAFIEAATKIELEVQFDFFDASVVKVPKGDLAVFLENLQFEM